MGATDSPPFALKLAIVAGAATLVVGLVGAVYLHVLGDGDNTQPEPQPRWVHLENMPTDEPVTVTVGWPDHGRTSAEEAVAGETPGTFALHAAPADTPVRLTVWRGRGAGRRVWIERSVTLRDTSPVIVRLP